jgi:hydroxymethylpyrimidine pyrophosphatase-like HAD family hydrolase
MISPTTVYDPIGSCRGVTDAATGAPDPGEADFFSQYEWCLNPLQKFSALCFRAQEELSRHDKVTAAWQRKEIRTNLYILLCAACCTLDDYLAHRPHDLSPVTRHVPGVKQLARITERGLNTAVALRRLPSRRSVLRTRKTLVRSVDSICEILVTSNDSGGIWERLTAAMQQVSCSGLPVRLLNWRARVPEGFRCQDLSHHDAVALARRFLNRLSDDNGPVLVVGLRTAGAYFAPLVNAYLVAQGFPTHGWMTIRPKVGMTPRERECLRRGTAATARILVVDDHPNTGATFARVLALFDEMSVKSDRVVILAPAHPAQRDWAQAAGSVGRVVLPFRELYKHQTLGNEAEIIGILRDLYGSLGWSIVSLWASPQLERLNAALSAQIGNTFEVRLKRAYGVRLHRDGEAPTERVVLAKSVGWGWLGYHAVLAGLRLQDFVPRVIGLREGLLFCEWVGHVDRRFRKPEASRIVPKIAPYVAARVNRLRLDENPNVTPLGGRPAGWDTLFRLIRRPYGRVLGRLFGSSLRAQLTRYQTDRPTLVDGTLGPDEWVESGVGLVKVDFEHHNFGGAQQDVVDGANDLACAIRDLDISAQDEASLLADYVRATDDESVGERLPFCKILCGISDMRRSAYCVVRASSREEQERWNQLYNRARDFLNIQMAQHCASRFCQGVGPATWSTKLFFLDLDGILDAELLSPLFQHTTAAGIEAISLLKAGGFSIVLNTARSVEQVKQYCKIYSLPGGIAEYGSVFFDAVNDKEVPLVDRQAVHQLERGRVRLERTKDVFVDPGYRWSLRAYRYQGDVTIGLTKQELERLLGSDVDQLSFVARDADSHIVLRGVDKGAAVSFVRGYSPRHQYPVAAIGDAAADLAMFAEADIAYVPANFDPALRRQLRGSKYRHLRAARQSALLAAAHDLTGSVHKDRVYVQSGSCHLLDHALYMADHSACRRFLELLRMKSYSRLS